MTISDQFSGFKKSGICILVLLVAAGLRAQAPNIQKALISIERIWDRAPHNAFTDLVYFRNAFYCTFREGTGHVPGINGSIRVIASEDGQNWYSVAQLTEEKVDLRDPKISVTPDGRLMLLIEAAYYEGKKVLKREPRVAFSNKRGRAFTTPQVVHIPDEVRSQDDWLWRLTWHEGTAYGVMYQVQQDDTMLHLLKTKDGLRYELVKTLDVTGKPNETTLRFGPGGEMLAVVRREGGDFTGMIGSSMPPYQHWNWQSLGNRLGGPNFLALPNGKLLCATRDYNQKEHRTALALIDRNGKFQKVLVLPSGGDTSYPGMVLKDGIVYLSYYSGHEGKTNIYLARLSASELGELPLLEE